ncbi:MAG: protein kinase [Leptolyngbyaceae cyanobacterium SL_1_1]|nr:protein kinase [Leptolyngbyaceae cyanobacterium RM1_1_2]NJO11696.1 protein kinase [Leptolyngbyaceae cyanobacterium SL_1_1]
MKDSPLAPSRGQRTLAAIVVTDAVGFSARMAADEEQTLLIIHQHLQLMSELCVQYEGRVLKSTGDGLLMYFASAVQAVSSGVKIQQQLAQVNQQQPPKQRLLHRIGIHLGDVFFSQSDVMGNGVNIAARLQTVAHPGCLCISQLVYDVVKARLTLHAEDAGPLQLKNIQEAVPAYHVSAFPPKPQPSSSAPPAPSARCAVEIPQADLSAGDKVAGRYTIHRLLGQGGFGRSYLAEDTQRFGELCVLKEFVPAAANRSSQALQKALALFKREAKTLYQISHPQVPKFLACFTQSQRLFIVQEYIDGVTYSDLMQRRQAFSETEVTQWLQQMLQVLEHLHELKIVHRDISPDNIIFSQQRNLPVLIDFGLVNNAITRLCSGAVQPADEAAASIVGKFGYSPPEQIRLGRCYPCSDLYALGVTAIVLLTNQHPRHLMDQDSLEWQWRSQANISRGLDKVLTRMLIPQPKSRYQSAREVLTALESMGANPLEPTWTESISAAAPTVLNPDPAFEFASSEALLTSQINEHSQFLDQCRQELAFCVGPMASLLIEDTLQQYPDISPQGLVEALASQISNAAQASEFVGRIQLPKNSGIQPISLSKVSAATGSQAKSKLTSETSVSAAFLSRCQQALAYYVGPMAAFLIEETLADHPNVNDQQLVSLLVAEIPDAVKAQEFQSQLL